VEDVFTMLYKSSVSQETLDDMVLYCNSLPHLSPKMAILCAEANARLGDTAEEFIMLDYATKTENNWGFLAKERLNFILNDR